MLAALAEHLRQSLGILHKQDIQFAGKSLGLLDNPNIRLGDDCAAIPEGDRYLLLATEGLLPAFVETDPWFAGWCAVMANVSDIYAMGGRPTAIVDTVWSPDPQTAELLFAGMKAAASAYQVPIVGGHTNHRSAYTALSVAILGQATQLITSFDARPGDRLIVAVDLRGVSHPKYPFWNAATDADSVRLRGDLAILPTLSESGLCRAGKDISMGGVIGTLLMLLETSECGATVQLDQIPTPPDVPLEQWLSSFPSYGFLLSVSATHADKVQKSFLQRNLSCAVIGEVDSSSQLQLQLQQESVLFWDFAQQPLTGWLSCREVSDQQPSAGYPAGGKPRLRSGQNLVRDII
jgi:uncharacterized protein